MMYLVRYINHPEVGADGEWPEEAIIAAEAHTALPFVQVASVVEQKSDVEVYNRETGWHHRRFGPRKEGDVVDAETGELTDASDGRGNGEGEGSSPEGAQPPATTTNETANSGGSSEGEDGA